MASFFSWGPTYDESIRNAEKDLLESIVWDEASFTTVDVPITVADEAHHIHTIIASHPDSERAKQEEKHNVSTYPIVLWHGYAQGAGSWWRCLPGLAKRHASQVNVHYTSYPIMDLTIMCCISPG